MSLSCECGNDDGYDWYYAVAPEPKPLATKRMRRCRSCNERIAVGDECAEVTRWRNAEYGSIEARIYGEDGEVPMASWWLCDRCFGLYESLDALGFCNLLGDDDTDMVAAAREYAQMQRAAGVFRGELRADAALRGADKLAEGRDEN